MLRTKIVRAETKALDDGRIEVIASTEARDRDGDIIRQAGWDLSHFVKHPVLLSSHDYYSLRSQIGEWEDVRVDGKRLKGVVRYYVGEGNEEADWGHNLAAKGRAAYSVGFVPLEYREIKDADGYGLEFTKQELLEISHVCIPANPQALQLMAKAVGLHPDVDAIVREMLADEQTKDGGGECCCPGCEREMCATMPMCKEHIQAMMSVMPAGERLGLFPAEIKSAIPAHTTPKADPDTTWDAGAVLREIEGKAKLRLVHAWVDAEGDAEAKGSYKLPHHLADGKVVWAGVAAAAQRLSGTQIPDDDVAGVKRHLARHYEQFDKTPPWENQEDSLDLGKAIKEAVEAALMEVSL